jgi:LysR family transcriptional regulator, nitrogen assimilation regulatory protein
MQFRHLRYFVKIVEAGSFSRAAATIHVAQPALSQQIADLEDRMGVPLLQRTPRGVRPTPAGEVLYREASSILKELEQLPGLLASGSTEAEGKVSLGFAISLAVPMSGPFLEACRAKNPKVTIKFADGDSESLEQRIISNQLDMAVVFEDELVPTFARVPLFRQRMFLISADSFSSSGASVSLKDIASLPLVLPSAPNARRMLIDRSFSSEGITPNVIAETDTLSSELSAIRAGLAHSILNAGVVNQIGLGQPLLIEPPIWMTCSIISSSDFPLTHAGEAVRDALISFAHERIKDAKRPGAEWIGPDID